MEQMLKTSNKYKEKDLVLLTNNTNSHAFEGIITKVLGYSEAYGHYCYDVNFLPDKGDLLITEEEIIPSNELTRVLYGCEKRYNEK